MNKELNKLLSRSYSYNYSGGIRVREIVEKILDPSEGNLLQGAIVNDETATVPIGYMYMTLAHIIKDLKQPKFNDDNDWLLYPTKRKDGIDLYHYIYIKDGMAYATDGHRMHIAKITNDLNNGRYELDKDHKPIYIDEVQIDPALRLIGYQAKNHRKIDISQPSIRFWGGHFYVAITSDILISLKYYSEAIQMFRAYCLDTINLGYNGPHEPIILSADGVDYKALIMPYDIPADVLDNQQ